MSEIRYDLLHDRYVIIAPERLRRPDYMAWRKEEQTPEACPFCEGNESKTPPELFALREEGFDANMPGWRTRVVPNLYKAVQIETPNQTQLHGIHKVWEGFGAHEVIIDTPRHHCRMQAWEASEYSDWLRTLQARLWDLRGDVRLVYISLFKNHGVNAGATQSHPHTQLIGLPVVPKSAVRMLERNREHFREHGRGVVEEIVLQEERDSDRIVAREEGFVAFCPFASAYPFEVMVTTTEPIVSLETMDEGQIRSLGRLLEQVFDRLDAQLGNFDFNLSIDHPPMHRSFDTMHLFDEIGRMCRFALHITPRIYRHGGFELSEETMINPVAPEDASARLRTDRTAE